MRIISGEMGGRRIKPPPVMPFTRPTTDLAKEGLFNMLQHRMSFEGIKTLDLFAGTGNISYELASRGATELLLVEKDPAMYSFIQKTISNLKIKGCTVVRSEVFSFLKDCSDKFDFIFAGPPYALNTIDELPQAIINNQLLTLEGWFVLEHTPRNNYEGFAGFNFQRNYGTTVFSFFNAV